MSQISIWSLFPAVMIGLFSYRKLNHETRWIALMLFVACIPHTVNFIEKLIIEKGEDSIRDIFYNTYMIFELLLLFIFFRRFFNLGIKKKVFLITFVLCVLHGIVQIWLNGMTQFLTTWLCFNNIAFTIWSLLLLYKLYENDLLVLQFSKPLLFYLFGLSFYTSCTIFAIGFWDYINSNKDSYIRAIRIIHPVFNVIMYTLFSYGFLEEVKAFNSQNKLKNALDK